MELKYAVKVVRAINKYVKENGVGHIMTTSEILDYVCDTYEVKNRKSIQPSDYAYNRCNNGLTDFKNGPHVFECVEDGLYRLWGTDYPYTGVVYHTEKKTNVTSVIGEWKEGAFTSYLVFEKDEGVYAQAGRLLDSLYEKYGLPNILSDTEIRRLRNEFTKNFSPERIEKWASHEVLEKFFDLKRHDGLLYLLTYSDKYNAFGSSKYQSNNRFPLYYNEKKGWCSDTEERLSYSQAQERAVKFRNKFVMCVKALRGMQLNSIEDYEKLGDYLIENLGVHGERMWIHKYINIVYPEIMSEFNSPDWKKQFLCAMGIEPLESFYGMAGQIAEVHRYMKLQDYYKIAHVIYTNYPEIGDGGICRMTFKPGHEEKARYWNTGSYVTIDVADFKQNIRKSKWFYGASELYKNNIFVVEDSNGRLIGTISHLKGEPQKGARFDTREGIWSRCFGIMDRLPQEIDGGDADSTIKKVENLLFIYEHYYSFLNAENPITEELVENRDAILSEKEAFDVIRRTLKETFPLNIVVMMKKTLKEVVYGYEDSFFTLLLDDLKYADGITAYDIEELPIYYSGGELHFDLEKYENEQKAFERLWGDACLLLCRDFDNPEGFVDIQIPEKICLKMLALYYPNKYLAVDNNDILRLAIEELRITIPEHSSIWNVQREMLAWKKTHCFNKESEIDNYTFVGALHNWIGQPIKWQEPKKETKPELIRYTSLSDISPELKKEYETIEREEAEEIFNITQEKSEVEYLREPQEKVLIEKKDSAGKQMPKRDPAKRKNAMILADYKCEIDPNHRTFISMGTGKPYVESHHLIPMEFYDNFEYSLDVEENIVCLCSNCHNEIHYGISNVDLIKKLYYARKDLLHSVGLDITEDELLNKAYRVEN